MEIRLYEAPSTLNGGLWPIVSILAAKVYDRYGEGEQTFVLRCKRRFAVARRYSPDFRQVDIYLSCDNAHKR